MYTTPQERTLRGQITILASGTTRHEHRRNAREEDAIAFVDPLINPYLNAAALQLLLVGQVPFDWPFIPLPMPEAMSASSSGRPSC